MILDSHVHFWDPRRLRYPWLDDVTRLNRPFTPADFPGGHEVIVVEGGRTPAGAGAEIAWLRTETALRPWIRGIVAHADLGNPTAVPRYAGDPFVVGVRHNVQDEAPGFLEGRDFRAGVRLLGEVGLPFDACVRAHQLPELAALAEACPRTTIVLDHLGKPSPGGPGYRGWRQDLRRLARNPAVRCKLSGLATETAPGTAPSVVVDTLREALDVFGPDRCLYGSDWPVMTLATGYDAWLDLVRTALDGYPAEPVLHGNAEKIYLG
ncbi:amidohydrolase family protein [Amycolatopsis solani]|uniref:amidohydrolase family protein n=1 Tax=Amycolatopsis solani TaxID=3028615 RepID=UPI0025AFC86D|nr:amidohydrolase family protein [Amycolatopsis sp. MEP2-6]